ncbi:MAG: hypothetical protein R8K22_08580 [Mariprofundaceae bacterium]
MNEQLSSRIVYSDAVEYDSWWCNRLFDETPYEVNFQWRDFWSTITRARPPSIHVPDSFEAGSWRQGLWEEVIETIGLRPHLADNDVRIRMEVFRLVEARWKKERVDANK